MNLRERDWSGVDWIHLARDTDKWRALVNTIMNLPVLWNMRRNLKKNAAP
jgi:hypothetical protein